MVYGDGGVGKTTLMIDLGFHLAAGDDWLGITVPRPLRVLVDRERGPAAAVPAQARAQAGRLAGLAARATGCSSSRSRGGSSASPTPTGGGALAETIREREVDVVIVGPLTASGMDAARHACRSAATSSASSTRSAR